MSNTSNGAFRMVDIDTIDGYVYKYPVVVYDEEGNWYDQTGEDDPYSSPEECLLCNRNEYNIFKDYGDCFDCLCPIDLEESDENCIKMKKVDLIANEVVEPVFELVDKDRIEKIMDKLYMVYKDKHLNKGLTALILSEWINLQSAIDFLEEVEELDNIIECFGSDLHLGNIGVLNNKPVIIDYGLTGEEY